MSSDQQQYNIQEILKLLPHRYPFILVDRILEVDPGERIKGLKKLIAQYKPPFSARSLASTLLLAIMVEGKVKPPISRRPLFKIILL